MKKPASRTTETPSRLIDARIRELGDWRGKRLAKMRALVKQAEPRVIEEWKWRGVPVWSCHGILCTGETYKAVVKLTFAKGAALKDPKKLFNASLEGNTRRAIDIREDDVVNEAAFRKLVKDAVKLNEAGKRKPGKAKTGKQVYLSGGNPQIAKADGDAPVKAYIDALSGWKRDVVRRVDALVARNAPKARKAVRWNSPFYGIEGRGWFLAVHVFTRYVKVTFFSGPSLKPVPPGGTRMDGRWIDIHEGELDEVQLKKWIRQAAALPGWGKN